MAPHDIHTREEHISSRGSNLWNFIIIFDSGALLFIILRLVYSVHARRFRTEDAAAMLAMGFMLLSHGQLTAAIEFGFGKHMTEVLSSHTGTYDWMALKPYWTSELVACFALFFAKVSIACTLLRIGLGNQFAGLVTAAVTISAIGESWTMVTFLGQCRPAARSFGDLLPKPCWWQMSWASIGYEQSVANVVANLLLTISPEVYFARYQIVRRDRSALFVQLALMVIVTSMSIAKTATIYASMDSRDKTWDWAGVSLFEIPECALGIMAASVSSIKQLFASWPRQSVMSKNAKVVRWSELALSQDADESVVSPIEVSSPSRPLHLKRSKSGLAGRAV